MNSARAHPRFPKDFKGWRPLYPLKNNRYLKLESPDGTKETCVHLPDYDIVGIIDKATGKEIYDGNIRLAKKLGLNWLCVPFIGA